MRKCNQNHFNPHLLHNTGKGETAKCTTSPGSDDDPLDNNPGIGH